MCPAATSCGCILLDDVCVGIGRLTHHSPANLSDPRPSSTRCYRVAQSVSRSAAFHCSRAHCDNPPALVWNSTCRTMLMNRNLPSSRVLLLLPDALMWPVRPFNAFISGTLNKSQRSKCIPCELSFTFCLLPIGTYPHSN